MRTTALLILPLLLLAACTTTPAETSQAQPCTPSTSTQEDRQCPFGMSFSEDYTEQEYFVIKPILPDLDAEDCEEALQERSNATKRLCRIQHAEIIREAGRQEGRDTWQWRIDCACSYEE